MIVSCKNHNYLIKAVMDPYVKRLLGTRWEDVINKDNVELHGQCLNCK